MSDAFKPYTVNFQAPDADHAASAKVALELFDERRRQARPLEHDGEGRSNADDDEYARGELASAAAAYAYAGGCPPHLAPLLSMSHKPARPQGAWHILETVRRVWPWSPEWWKPECGPRRCLVKAGALIIAAIEKLDRETARAEAEREAAASPPATGGQ